MQGDKRQPGPGGGGHRCAGLAAAMTAAALGFVSPALGQEPCRLALVLALDVSGSVDPDEYRLQMDGLSRALLAPPVADRLLEMPGAPVAILAFEWSDAGAQAVIADWRRIDGQAALVEFAYRIRSHQRSVAPDATSIGSAMTFAAARFADGPACWRRTLDISGDGRNNARPEPEDMRLQPGLSGVTINGLVIGADSPSFGNERLVDVGELVAYYSTAVIAGSGAFVEAALGFEDFQRAMTRKLLRELPTMSLGAGPGGAEPMPGRRSR